MEAEAELAEGDLGNPATIDAALQGVSAVVLVGHVGSSTGDGRIGMVDTRDVAAVAAEIAASPAPHKGKTYWPTGPERLSYSDAAAVLSKVLGRPIVFHPLTFDEQKQAMINVGLPEATTPQRSRESA